jgi:GNAT superfamily N-acetyltransferase
MTAAERQAALDGEASEYAEAKSRAGIWAREGSLSRARKEIASTVGSDPDKRGHEFFFGVGGRGQRIGWAWFGPMPGSRLALRKRWLYQIIVDESFRGQGYGRGLLQAVERGLLDEGVVWLHLNVFRWNSVAVELYSSSGYEIVSPGAKGLEMRKRLVPASGAVRER